jgi:NAD(P)-dependent dehydrogenase (short-subunit alcohol dehydrogenase family)
MTKSAEDLSGIPGRLDGKTCLITGANSGLGKAMAIELAGRGAAVIMACRRNYTDAVDEIKEASGNPNISLRLLDLSSLASARAFCAGLHRDGIHLDVALFNAGMAAGTNELSPDGYTPLWQVNYLSNVLIVRQLLQDGVIANTVFNRGQKDRSAAGIPRIIFTSSSRHRENLSIDFDRFGHFPEFSLLDTFKYYGLSKLYLMTYAWELGKRLINGEKPQVSVSAFCPGAFRSGIGEDLGFFGNLIMSTRPVSPRAAAWPGITLACSPELEGKTLVYYHRRSLEEPDPRVSDPTVSERLWMETEKIFETAFTLKGQ